MVITDSAIETVTCCHTIPKPASSHMATYCTLSVNKVLLTVAKHLKLETVELSSCCLALLLLITVFSSLFSPHRYYHGPTPIQSQQYATSQDIINSFHSIRQEMEAYVPKLTQVWKYILKVPLLILASCFLYKFCVHVYWSFKFSW